MALGIVLILVGAAIYVAFILYGANDPATVDIAGLKVDTSSLVVFVIGAIATALIFLGMRSLLNGIRRDVRRMRQTRDLKQKAEKATRAAEEANRAAKKAAEEKGADKGAEKPSETSDEKTTPAKPSESTSEPPKDKTGPAQP